MSQYLSPGVYIREIPAVRPIEGVGTATAAFVGVARGGPRNEPRLITSWRQYRDVFGERVGDDVEVFADGFYLAHAVYGFFLNGGSRCYVVNVAPGSNGNGSDGGSSSSSSSSSSTPEDPEAADAEESPDASDASETEEDTPATRRSRSRSSVPATADAAVPARIAPDDLVGTTAARSGVGGLEAVDEVTMVCVPDLVAPSVRDGVDGRQLVAAQRQVLEACSALGDRVAILDPPPSLDAQQVAEWRQEAGFDTAFGALYWPWLEVANPFASSRGNGGADTLVVPPSGFLAGVWARVDGTRGVHKAPANEQIHGIVGLETQITRAEQDGLNPIGVNCIREFPGTGVRVWGARTLAETQASWRYLNVRRLFNYLEESILEAMQWVVFEPNDRALWAKIRRQVGAFLVNVWRSGALFGSTPDEAFYVKCDDETNPQEGIEAGEVVCEIGVAAVKPAEFIVFKIHQLPTGVSVVAE